MQTAPCWPGGLFLLGDDRQERGFQGLGLGVEDDQAIEDLLPHRFAGQVSLLVPGPGTWRDTPRSQARSGQNHRAGPEAEDWDQARRMASRGSLHRLLRSERVLSMHLRA